MDSSGFSLYSLLIVSLLALVVPLLLSRIRFVNIPIVVGEIVAGVIVGKSGFNIIQQSEWLQFLEFFGLAYLMFVSGLEIDFQALRMNKVKLNLRSLLISPPVFALVSCAITLCLAYIFSKWLYHQEMIRSPLLFALIITTTSLTVVVPVLKESGLISHSFGQLLLAAAVLADFVTMLLISVAVSLFQGGFSASVLLVFVLISVLIILYFIFKRFSNIQAIRSLAHGTAQIGIRASLALMIIFIVLSQTLGVQVILGTFLAGVLVGLVSHRERTDMYQKLDAIGFGFLIPIFFIMVGVNFDIESLFHDMHALLLFPLLFVATYVFKGLPVLLLRFRYPWRQTWAGTALLTTQMSVTVAAASVGLKIGAISNGVDTAIVLVAMLTSIISPVLFGKLVPKDLKINRDTIVIVGNSAGAQLLVEQIGQRQEGFQWLTDIHQNDKRLEAVTPDLLSLGIDLDSVHSFVAYSEEDQTNLDLARQAANNGIEKVVCIVRDFNDFQIEQQTSEFLIVNPQIAAVTLIDQLLHYPISTQLLKAPASLQIQEIVLTNHDFHQARLMNLRLPGNLLILSIVRDDSQIIPHGETSLQVGDMLIVVGNREDIGEFRKIAGNV